MVCLYVHRRVCSDRLPSGDRKERVGDNNHDPTEGTTGAAGSGTCSSQCMAPHLFHSEEETPMNGRGKAKIPKKEQMCCHLKVNNECPVPMFQLRPSQGRQCPPVTTQRAGTVQSSSTYCPLGRPLLCGDNLFCRCNIQAVGKRPIRSTVH